MEYLRIIWKDVRNYLIGIALPCLSIMITVFPILRNLHDNISEEFSGYYP